MRELVNECSEDVFEGKKLRWPSLKINKSASVDRSSKKVKRCTVRVMPS